MRILTLRGCLKNVANMWRNQYVGWPEEPWQRKLRELEQLDLETATTEQIVAITGDDSWVDLRCCICEKSVNVVIVLHRHSMRINICKKCIQNADAMIMPVEGSHGATLARVEG